MRGRDCEAFNSDLKIGIATGGISKSRTKKQTTEDFITYPDCSIVCGKLEYYKGDRFTVANPTVLFEVLSPSTRNYDRSFKLEQYQKIPSLKAYVMLDSEQVRLEYYSKVGEGEWVQRILLESEDALTLQELSLSLPLHALYARVEFEGE